MKILFFNYEYPPLGGGAAYASQNILKEYSKIPGLEVDFVTSSIDNEYHLEKVSENIRVHRLSIGKNESNMTYQSQKELLIYAWKAYIFSKKLIEEAEKNKKPYDLTHSFFTVPCGFVSMLLKRKYKLPYIVSLRGSDVPGYSERFSAIYYILTPIIVHIWKKAEAVMANSQLLKELALKSYSKREIGVIYNGINVDYFRPGVFPKNKNFTLLCASRLSRRKGFNYAIDAFAKIHEKYPEARLVIAGGEGNAEEEWKKQVKDLKLEDKITFTGFVTPNTEFLKYYNAADVFVFPSANEGMSNNMLEAMASGLAVIMTPTGGANELVKDGANGYIVGFRDSVAIAEKMETLINNPELCRRMGEESRRIAETMSWQSVAGEYFELYKKVI
ncbi:MAG: glycosyltransferase family 4 protein [Candidatus Pacebacteria bacterium]|nr:glycosyltransferase family 4 protein [Candidatus Paceibacterota bacterium]